MKVPTLLIDQWVAHAAAHGFATASSITPALLRLRERGVPVHSTVAFKLDGSEFLELWWDDEEGWDIYTSGRGHPIVDRSAEEAWRWIETAR